MVALPTALEDMSVQVADQVSAIEARLSDLERAFASGDGDQIAHHTQGLQSCLAASIAVFRKADQLGMAPLSGELRTRLTLAQTRVQAQQAAVHRASASIDRTLNVLFPGEDNSTYGKLGQSPAAQALNKAYR